MEFQIIICFILVILWVMIGYIKLNNSISILKLDNERLSMIAQLLNDQELSTTALVDELCHRLGIDSEEQNRIIEEIKKQVDEETKKRLKAIDNISNL